MAVPSLKLKARIKPNPVNQSHLSPQEQPNLKFKVSDLSHIHYTVVEISNIGQTIKTDKADNSGARRCYEPSHIQKDGAGRNGWFESSTNFSTIATGTFADMSNLKGTGNKSIIDTDDNGFVDIDAGNKTEGQQSVVGNRFTDNDAGWSPYINLPTTKGVYLARQYNNDSVKGDLGSFGITFVGATASAGRAVTTTKYFRVYIWVDGGYTYTNIGSEVEQGDGVPIQDPLQNAVIEVNWSEDSMIQQVTG